MDWREMKKKKKYKQNKNGGKDVDFARIVFIQITATLKSEK